MFYSCLANRLESMSISWVNHTITNHSVKCCLMSRVINANNLKSVTTCTCTFEFLFHVLILVKVRPYEKYTYTYLIPWKISFCFLLPFIASLSTPCLSLNSNCNNQLIDHSFFVVVNDGRFSMAPQFFSHVRDASQTKY